MTKQSVAALVLTTLLSAPAVAGDFDTRAAVGGGLGGALGALIGSEVGGRSGAILGGGLGGALGSGIAGQGSEEKRYVERHYYYPAKGKPPHRHHRYPGRGWDD